MRRTGLLMIVTCLLLDAAAGRSEADVYTSISLAGVANARLQGRHPEYPSGDGVLLGDVPFDIPTTGPNMWSAAAAAGGGSGVVSATVPIGMTNVTGVHTLINTLWGVSGGPGLATLRFAFDDGTFFVKQLIGDVDIRDYYQNTWTNSINGTTTVRVFFTDTDYNAGPNRYRLDKQFIDLSAYRDKTLVSMTLVDRGDEVLQRTWLAGLTVQAVPEPSCLTLAAVGGAFALGLGRLKKRRGPRPGVGRLAALMVIGVGLAGPAARADFVSFNDRAAFLAATGASDATGPLPSTAFIGSAGDPIPGTGTTVGSVTYQAVRYQFRDWSTRLPGNEVGVSFGPDGGANDGMNLLVASPVYSLGFDFVEAQFDPNGGGTFVDSTFTVTLRNGATAVHSFTFNAPNDTAAFVGVWGSAAFNRVEIRETIGDDANEYYGRVYTGSLALQAIPEPSCLTLAAVGGVIVSLARLRRRPDRAV